MGGIKFTSTQALQRFFEALTAPAHQPAEVGVRRTTPRRPRQDEQAAVAELERAGV